jgi:hypothetical protein
VDIAPGMMVIKPGGHTTGDVDGQVNGVLTDAFIDCPLLIHRCCYMTTEWTVITAHQYQTSMSAPGDSGSLVVERRPARENVERIPEPLRVVGLLFGGGMRLQPPHGVTYPPRAMAGMEVSFITPARKLIEWVKADTGMDVEFDIGL